MTSRTPDPALDAEDCTVLVEEVVSEVEATPTAPEDQQDQSAVDLSALG